MQTQNRILDDLARVAASAVGAVQGARHEVEAAIRRVVADDALVDEAAAITGDVIRSRLDTSVVRPAAIAMYEQVIADNAGLLVTGKDSTFQNRVHLALQAKGFFEKGDGDANGGN